MFDLLGLQSRSFRREAFALGRPLKNDDGFTSVGDRPAVGAEFVQFSFEIFRPPSSAEDSQNLVIVSLQSDRLLSLAAPLDAGRDGVHFLVSSALRILAPLARIIDQAMLSELGDARTH